MKYPSHTAQFWVSAPEASWEASLVWLLPARVLTRPTSAVLRTQMTSSTGIMSDKDIHKLVNFCPVSMFSSPYVSQNQNSPTHRHWLQGRVPACLAGMDADAWIPPLPEGCKTESSMFPVCNVSGRIHQPLPMKTTWGLLANMRMMNGWARASWVGLLWYAARGRQLWATIIK